MLSTLITSKTRRDLLVLFITHPNERYYLRQLVRVLSASTSQLQKELGKLEAIGFLTSSRESNTRFYQVDTSFPLLPELKSMVYKTSGLADHLRAALADIGTIEFAAVFGSVAKNVEDMRSDIDLLVIGDIDMEALHEAIHSCEQSIGREVNPVVFSREDWDARVESGQAFVQNIVRGPRVVLMGDECDL